MSGKSISIGGMGAVSIIVMVLIGAVLSGCSMGPHYAAVDQSKGGARARIMSVLTPPQAMQAEPACLAASAVAAAGNWVKAEFRRDRMRSTVIALVPFNIAVNVNDQVELQPEVCADGKLFHVVAILRAQVNAPEHSPAP